MSRVHFGVFIARLQPLHIGHEYVIRKSLEQCDRLIVLIGSSHCARDPHNPFSYEEREAMLRSVFPYEVAEERLIIRPLVDHLYSDTAWVRQVQQTVSETVLEIGNAHGFQNHGVSDFNIALAGYGKDNSSYYLKLFPDMGNIQIDSQYGTFNASDIRARYLQPLAEIPAGIVPEKVAEYLGEFRLGDDFRQLVAEAQYLAEYPQKWGRGPFVTADALVIQSGHVLLVERGEHPGKGLLALPGGFVNPDEHIRDAAIRELREETAISDHKGQIPPAMLSSFIEDSRTQVFDAPKRSLRGRIITHVFLFRLPGRKKLFTLKAGSDAARASWYRLGDLSPEMFFEDHWAIIEQMADL